MLKLKCGQATNSKNIPELMKSDRSSIRQPRHRYENNQLEAAKPEFLPLILHLFAPDEESFIQSARHFLVDLVIGADVLHAGHQLGHPVPELQAPAGAGAAQAAGAAPAPLRLGQGQPQGCILAARRCHLLPPTATP